MEKASNNIIVYSIVTVLIIMFLGLYIIGMLYLYQKKQRKIANKLKIVQEEQEKIVLKAQLEMQEQTFNQISKEIHDNISLSLTLAKLNLNTIDFLDLEHRDKKMENTIELITRSILELNDISKSLNSDIIINNGILKALDLEISRIRNAGIFNLNYEIVGIPVFGDSKKEILVFRIIQEGFNNILKHSEAKNVSLTLDYKKETLNVLIKDDGNGFEINNVRDKSGAGLSNISNRIKLLNGTFLTRTFPGQGTELYFSIPIE